MNATLTAAYFQVNSEMDTRIPTLLVLFPGALGDFVCLLPTLAALQERFNGLTVAARPSLLELLPAEINRFSIERREMADLFGSAAPHEGTRHLLAGFTQVLSWTGHGHAGFADRLGAASGAQVAVHPFRGMRDGEHAACYYARCAGVWARAWTLTVPADAHDWAAALLQPHAEPNTIVIHAGSGSAAKNWRGFPALAERWRQHGPVIWIVGPADDAAQIPRTACVVRDQPLPRIAALLQRTPLYVGNDSGVSHLAGIAGARGLALFGPSDPIVWRPLGLHLLRGAPTCDACCDIGFCTHRLSVALTHAMLRSIRAAAA